MITRVTLRNFKSFRDQTFPVSDTIVLAGPNNSGKSTLLQALSTWALARDRWRLKRAGGTETGRRNAVPITRRDFTSLPLREFDLLWPLRSTALSKDELVGAGKKPGEPRLIEIEVAGTGGVGGADPWSLTMELRYQGPEQIYVKPTGARIPESALEIRVVHCPPFSGIGAEERRLDFGAQNHELGKGKPGEVLRNLILEVWNEKTHWEELVQDIQELFRFTLLPPQYEERLTPFILCEYLPGIPNGKGRTTMPHYDIASGGSGFHQVLLLLSFFYARPASILLLDEPDAHLHVVLQRQIYDRLRDVANRRRSQMILATHSEVLLDGTPPTRVISFLGAPHGLVHALQKDQVREAMSRLTTLDLMLAEEKRAILYCEGESDFKILSAWARVIAHPAQRFFENPFFHAISGSNPREAKRHLFALRAIHPLLRGLLLLDGDNRGLSDHEVIGDGLEAIRWTRYEIENYLIVPDAIARFLGGDAPDLFQSAHAEAALDYLRSELPPSTFHNPLVDNETLKSVRASKDLLPRMFEAAGFPMEKGDYFLLAEKLRPAEVHPDVRRVLDRIASLIG